MWMPTTNLGACPVAPLAKPGRVKDNKPRMERRNLCMTVTFENNELSVQTDQQ